jgi:DNA polymerase-1
VIDYLALVGDSSDNVPGVPGIGDKTARDLVNEYGSLESILAAAEQITKKRPREALLEHAGRARLSKELVTIRDDLPVSLETSRLRVQPADLARLRQIYIELEFTTLVKDVARAGIFCKGNDHRVFGCRLDTGARAPGESRSQSEIHRYRYRDRRRR